MISNLFIHTITAIRYAQTGQNALMEPLLSASSYGFSASSGAPTINELPCRVEEFGEVTQYRLSNARLKNATLIYLPPQFQLLEKDYVYWGTKHKYGKQTNDFIGIITGIDPAYKGTTNKLDHWEVIIENP